MGYKISRYHSPVEFFVALAIGLLLKSNTVVFIVISCWIKKYGETIFCLKPSFFLCFSKLGTNETAWGASYVPKCWETRHDRHQLRQVGINFLLPFLKFISTALVVIDIINHVCLNTLLTCDIDACLQKACDSIKWGPRLQLSLGLLSRCPLI